MTELSNLLLKKSPLLVNWSHASPSLLLKSFNLVSTLYCPSWQFKLIISCPVTKEKRKKYNFFFFSSYFLCIWRLQFVSKISHIRVLWSLNLSSGATLASAVVVAMKASFTIVAWCLYVLLARRCIKTLSGKIQG